MREGIDVLAGGGELGERMRAIDWSSTSLGPVESWPQSLKTCIRIILTSSQPMFVWWGEHLINLYNDAYCSILGGKHPWALGRPAAEVWREIWEDVGPRAETAIRENRGTFDEALLLIMERNGYREETYYTFSYSPVPGDRGGPGGILCANSSDTQRIFGERQQALLRDVGAVTSDARTVDEVCDRAMRALAADSRDLPFAMLFLCEDTPRLYATSGIDATHPLCSRLDLLPVSEVARSGVMKTCSLAGVADLPMGPWEEAATEAIGIPVAGEAVLVVARNPYRRLDDDYRRFLELLARQIASAIAAAKAYEAERRRAEALAELDRAKTSFFSNISHEFRTPLTLMLGPTEDALRSPGESLAGDSLRAVHRNELRLLKLVNGLLDFSRIEAGRVRAHYEPTDLSRFTRDLASAFRSAMQRAGLWFEVECLELPAAVNVDREMWEKIVLNLLSNALKFTFEGGVTVRLSQRDGNVELYVSDTGTGIPADELPRLFERFYRVEGARSRTHEGSGIGLALVHELVKLHGGTIDVDSAVGRGTTFHVRIPMMQPGGTGEQVRPGQISAGVTAFVEEAMRWLPETAGEHAPHFPLGEATVHVPREIADAHVLVADDNADMRDYLRRLIGERWRVTLVANGAQALEAARRSRPDLILTDVMMPVLDGFGLLRAVRQDETLASIPIVMLSARAGEEARVEGIEAGADDYLIKPFSARELTARVTNMLQLARLRRDVELERNRLADFIHQTPVGVVVWEGPELRLHLANEAYARMARRPLVIGTPLVEVFPELAGTETLHRIQRVHREGVRAETRENFVPLRLSDGTVHNGYFSTVYQPLRGPDGQATGVMVVTSEVTEQVMARQLVEQSRAEAVAANRAKDEFLAMLGHELRNPLAPILTAVELMRLRFPDVGVREREVIARQTAHLSSLVDDLLDVSRIARGKVELKREDVRVADILAKAVETVAPLYEEQQHELTTDVAHDVFVHGDPARLVQVVANLLTNAAKYTDRGGHVTIRCHADGDRAVISVEDTGRGIAADMLPHVFDLFVQERQNLDRARGGLGLGLAIVRNLVELHDGRVSATSRGPGQGSTFTVVLPRVDAMRTSGQGGQQTAAHVEHGVDRPSVLVVDDNVDAASLLSELLDSLGYQTRVAHDAPQVLSLRDDEIPDVALLDIGLPAMDGYELARRLRSVPRWQGVKLIAVTGYGQNTDRQRSKDAGFDHHMVKPINLAALEDVLPTRP